MSAGFTLTCELLLVGFTFLTALLRRVTAGRLITFLVGFALIALVDLGFFADLTDLADLAALVDLLDLVVLLELALAVGISTPHIIIVLPFIVIIPSAGQDQS